MNHEPFAVGITPDFYTEAKGKFEHILESQFSNLPGLGFAAMPAQPGNVAEPATLNQYDAIFALATKVNAESVKGVDRLAVIARWGVGYDMIDVDAITEAGIALAITPNAVRRPVAEAIFTLLFALTTNLLQQDRLVRQGKWRGEIKTLGRNFRGRTLGSLGCGNIAGEMFSMAQSLGFGRMIAADPFVTNAPKNVEIVSMETLFAESDYLAVNTLLNAGTRGLVSETLLRRMKPTSYLINTARGPIVDEPALIRALEEGWIAGAGLDVFETEPLPPGNKLRELDNVILAPHGLAWTEEIVRDNGLEACANILSIYRGEAPATIVNKEVLNHPGFQKKLAGFRR